MRTKNKLIHEGIFENLQSMNFYEIFLGLSPCMSLLDPVDMPYGFFASIFR